MSVNKFLVVTAVGLAATAAVVTVFGLIHELTSSHDTHMLVHTLEAWLEGQVYHTALIVLAAAGVVRLVRK